MDEPTILIVDDEQAVADIYATHLEDEYDVQTAYSGEEALEKIDQAIDTVLLDRQMPGMSGDEVLAEIKDRGYDIRVAMVTAVDPDFDILNMGFDDYVVKPVSADVLRETVDQLLSYASYDDTFEEYYRLVSKRAALQTAKTESALETNDEYRKLTERIEQLEADLDETMTDLDGDVEPLFGMTGPDVDSDQTESP